MKRFCVVVRPTLVLAAAVLVVVGGLLGTGCGAAKDEGPYSDSGCSVSGSPSLRS